MAYEPTTWAAGDVVTSAKLNKMEAGIAGGVLVIGGFTIGQDGMSGTSDKTWQEIYDALSIGARVIVLFAVDDAVAMQYTVEQAYIQNGEYIVKIRDIVTTTTYTVTTNSADGYPTVS